MPVGVEDPHGGYDDVDIVGFASKDSEPEPFGLFSGVITVPEDPGVAAVVL